MMTCPACQEPLITVERNNLEVDHCLKCKGTWFDRDELDLFPTALGLQTQLHLLSLIAVQSHEAAKACPRCKKAMSKVTLAAGSTLILDQCPNGDGLWFDHGELGAYFSTYSLGNAEHPVMRFLGETISFQKESV